MSDDLNTEIKIGADASGVEAGVGRAKRSLATLGDAATKAGKDGGNGMELLAVGGDKAAAKVESATRSMQNSIQRLIAEQKAGAKGSREYYEALADTRGISRNSIKTLLDQLDEAKRKTDEATNSTDDWRESLGKINGVEINGVAIGATFAAAVVGVSAMVKKTIDAADSFSKLSAKSGVAVESLRELNYAASLSDVSTESLGVGLRKLSQNMALAAGGSKLQAAAFDAIGVSLKAADGSLKSADTMLKELSSKFATFKDGPEKAALAIDLFGKQGAEMIPLLNGGAAGLAEMADEANRLGIVFDGDLAKNAEAFNDNLTRIQTRAEGAAVAITKELLPTLNNLAQAFVDSQNNSQSFASWLGGGLRIVVEAATILLSDLKFVLEGLGRGIGAIGAAYVALAKFDIQGFKAISEAVKEDDKEARRVLDKFQFDLLNARFLNSSAGAGRGTAPDPRSLGIGEGTVAPIVPQGTGDTVKKVVSEYDKLIQKLSDELPKAAAEAEAAQMGYNKAQTEFLALAASPAWAKFTNDQRATVAALFENKIASEQSADAAKTLAKANLDAAASREKYLTSLSAGLDKIQADITAQIEATERMGLSKEAIADLDAAKLEMLATDLELQAIKAMDRNLDQQTYDALKKQAAAYRELGIAKKGGAAKEAALELEKANAEAAKKAQEDWQRTSDQINQSLTDALLRGFESGKDFAKNMRDTIVNMFKTMVLRPVVSAIVSPVAGAITGALGLSTAAQAGQGGASSGVSTALSGASLLGSVGGSLAAGAGWLTGATTLGGSLSAGMSLLGTGSLAGAGAGLGMIAGALAPIALGIGALSSAFSRKLKDQGIQGTLGGDAGFEGQQYKFYKGGLFRSDKTVRSELDPKLDSRLDAAVRQMQQSMLGLADSFGLPTEAITGFTQSIKLSFNGLDEAGIQAKIQEALTGYNEALAGAFIESMENSEVPAWVDRLIGNTDASAVQRLQDVAEWPARLLQSFGASRDDLVRMFTEGLASGDAMAAGQSVADTLVASIQNAVFTNAAGQIFDIVNQGIVTPMLDAIATGASVSEALSQATIDKTIERAKAQAQALAELYGNAEFAAALEQLRTAVGGALGQAGSYLQTLPQALVATQQIDTAAQDAARAAEEAQRAWQQITDGLLADQAALQIDLLRAQGREEEALARERALAIEGMDAYQTALYDSNRALRSQIDTLRELGELLPSVIDKYLTPEQRTQASYDKIAADLGAAGVNVSAQTLMGASKDQIAQAAVAIYNLGTTSDETRLALIRAASGLADLKDAAEAAAEAALEEARGTLDGLIKSLAADAARATGTSIGRLGVTGAEYEQYSGFADAIGSATKSLQDLEALGLGDEFQKYADQIGAIVRETETLLAGQLSTARLLQGNAAGALAALGAVGEATGNNAARARMDADNALRLYAQASADALAVSGIDGVLGTLQSILADPQLWQPAAQAITQGIVQASGDVGFAVRDAVAGVAEVLARQGLTSVSGPGIAGVHAAQAKLDFASVGGWARGSWQMGEDVVAYGQALDRLDGMLKTGKLSAQEHADAIGALNTAMGGAAALLGDTAAQAERLAAAQQALGDAGLQSIDYYFSWYGRESDRLAEAARQAGTALGQTTDAIGRLGSASSVFAQSAAAAASWEDYAGLSSVSKARLVADSARTAAAAMTTADAERAAAALAKTGAFGNARDAALMLDGAFGNALDGAFGNALDGAFTSVRDAALMLDGVGQYDSKGFEDAFTRIGAALGRGQISEAQYKALFDTALELYKTGTTSAAEAARKLTGSFERLRDVMGDFADGLLIGDKTTLDASQTLAEIQRQYATAFGASAQGDTDAMGKYTELAGLLLDKDRYSTQAEYNAAFGSVYGDARQLEAIGINTLANAQGDEMVSELKDMNAKLNKRVEDLEKNLLAALAQIAKNTSDTSRGIEQQIVMAEDTP